jgi:hypothetical protein
MLTTKQKVKDFLGITNVTSDTAITEIVKNTSSQIEVYCNRSFASTTYTEYIDTSKDYRKIWLRNFPVSSITSLKYRDGVFSNLTWTSFNANDYLLTNEMGKLYFAYDLPERDKYIEAVYVGGYLIDFANESDITKHTLPAGLTQIATEMCANTFNLSKSSGIQSESTEGQSITYGGGNESKLNKRLDLFRNYNANF